MIFSDWRITDHHTLQEAKLLNILHCLEHKEKLTEQKNLVSSYLYLFFDWFKTIKAGPGGGGGL